MNKSENYKQFIQNGFDTVARGYDHPSLFFFPETAKRIVGHLNLRPHYKLLDVCTGTGVVALTAAEKLTEGEVTGIDLSTGMLQQARDKAKDRKLKNTCFEQMDMEDIEFPDESFDIATSSFGLFFLEDMTKGLQSISNTVKPGGQVVISSFTGEAFSPMADVFIKHYEATGREVPPLSWRRLSTNKLIEEQFKAVGITKVEIHHEPLGYQMTSAQMWWDVVWNAGWRSLLNQLSEDEQKVFKKGHMDEIEKLIENEDEGVWFNTEVLIAVGEKN